MNYNLELNTQEIGSDIVFNNIIFDFFKVNIIERHVRTKKSESIKNVLFKLRTLDNEIITCKKGNSRVKLKDQDLETYTGLIKVLNSFKYKNNLIDRKAAEQQYVDFILRLVVINYTLN